MVGGSAVTRVPLKLDGKTVGHAEVDTAKGKVRATVTDPVAAAELAQDTSFGFSIASAAPPPFDREPRPEDRPSHEQARSNQLHGHCGGTRWRYLGGDCLGWWEPCSGCKACEP